MNDIEVVIKIPERIHYGIEKGITVNGSKASQILIDAVKNGIPLPKGHGRLIDADAIKKHYPIMENDFGMVFNEHLHKELDNEPTIIKADKEGEE